MLPMDLKGKKAFVAGVGDDQGFGWAIAKALCEAGAHVMIGTWTPMLPIFQMSWDRGKFNESRRLKDGSLMEFAGVYALDASYDFPEDMPQDVKESKRYVEQPHCTVSEVAKKVEQEHGKIDILVHSLANGPEVKKPLLETSRQGYLSAVSASSYSFVSLLAHFGSIMNPGGSVLSLTYIASQKAIPGYGGGMSSAKAALESDCKTLAFEAGRKWGLRVNCISAGPWRSRAAKAIGFVGKMIHYAEANAPILQDFEPEDVAMSALFLLSPWAKAITGTTLYVDNGLNIMGIAVNSPSMQIED